jgi:hypothetical protein
MGLMNKYAVLKKHIFSVMCLMLIFVAPLLSRAEEEPKSFLQFVEEFSTGVCSQRQGKAVLIKSTHGTRKIKVVLDRFNSGVGTGDRSRSVLEPGAEPEALGCSRSDVGAQEWRVVKAEFVE